MDAIMVVLRSLHIGFGIFLIGNGLFATLILEPRLRALGAAVQGPVMGSVMPVMTRTQAVCFVVVLATGSVLTYFLRGNFSQSGSNWGWAILAGLVITLVSAVISFGMVTPLGIRMMKLGASIQGRAPTPDEAQRMAGMAVRARTLTRVLVTLSIAIVVCMAGARYL